MRSHSTLAPGIDLRWAAGELPMLKASGDVVGHIHAWK